MISAWSLFSSSVAVIRFPPRHQRLGAGSGGLAQQPSNSNARVGGSVAAAPADGSTIAGSSSYAVGGWRAADAAATARRTPAVAIEGMEAPNVPQGWKNVAAVSRAAG